MSPRSVRVGQIVPSSNVTMETEIPEMLRRHASLTEDIHFTFHSSRMRMKTVDKAALAAMDRESDRCALELSDASVDVIGYACLVAIMATGPGYHCESAERLHDVTRANGSAASVVTSAGALVDGLRELGAERISLLTPYMKPLTDLVVEYLEDQGLAVCDSISLEIADNLEVAAHDPRLLPEHIERLDTSNADVVVLSACVQMPSLPVLQEIEDALGKPVLTAAAATAWAMLRELDRPRLVPGAGALLAGGH